MPDAQTTRDEVVDRLVTIHRLTRRAAAAMYDDHAEHGAASPYCAEVSRVRFGLAVSAMLRPALEALRGLANIQIRVGRDLARSLRTSRSDFVLTDHTGEERTDG